MYVVTILLVGVVLGLLDRFASSGARSSLVATTVFSVAGALTAGMIARGYGWFQTPFHLPGIAAALVGAMLALLVRRMTARSPRVD